MTDQAKMTPEELNVAVAERVMGWRSTMGRPTHWGELHAIRNLIDGTTTEPYRGPWFIPPGMSWADSPDNGVEVPPYSTDVAADYSVLVHVRATWEERKMWDFGRALSDAWRVRMSANPLGSNIRNCGMTQLLYEPGDFARAALSALES